MLTLIILCSIGIGNVWGVTNGDVFTRISSVSDLSAGDEIIFVNQAETYACNTTQNNNNRSASSISTSNHSYTYNSSHGIQVFVVKIYNGNYGFHTGSGYLYSGSGSNNYLKTNSTSASTNPSGTAAWSLSVSNYVFSITNSSNTSYYLAFNGNTIFSQYKQNMTKPYIYKKQATTTYSVTYNANNATSGTVPTDATAYSSGATVTVKGNTGNLERTGYTFGGWNTNAEGTGTNYTAGSGQFQISANTTLYAKWNPTYTVTYNGNGNNSGSVPVDGSSPYSANATVTVLGNTGNLAKTGWTFAGWNTNATGTGTNRAAGSTFSITANTTLYAKWTCTVTWSVNGATNVYSAQTITYNSSGSKVSSVPTPDPASYCGQVFAGWTTEEYSGNSAPGVLFKTVGDSPNLNSTGSVTFYAVFADYAN